MNGKKIEKMLADPKMAAELKRLRKVERRYAILQQEHAILQPSERSHGIRERKSNPA
jgi:hypothetical protein